MLLKSGTCSYQGSYQEKQQGTKSPTRTECPMSENDVENAEPVESGGGNESVFLSPPPSPKQDKPSVWVWIGLSGLLLTALAVIFVLPSVVEDYELPLERRAEAPDLQDQEPTALATTNISPFEEAQRSLQRKEAQDVLAELLLIQGDLEVLEVEAWALSDYEAALEQASIGDEYYRTQDFLLARDTYASGRDSLGVILETVPTVLEQTLIEAQQALEQLRARDAQEKFALALLFAPENEDAQIGLRRAESLDDVSGLFAMAEDQRERGELEQARDSYQQIINLDAYNEAAREELAAVSARILENRFASIMSSGYALLEQAKPQEAIAEFQRASSLGINQDQASAAITQTENEISNAQISQLRAQIFSAELQEQWQDAVAYYDEVLIIDSNLTFAVNGKDYAQKRAQLDALLVEALDNPERFSEDAVFQQTLDVYYTGRAIEDAGPHLTAQLDELEPLLESSQLPIDVQLRSDNITEVTLLRIGNLGVFQETAVSLKPGRYVVVGKRPGFREVREEFTVGFGQTPDAVIVQCDEPVVAANRR